MLQLDATNYWGYTHSKSRVRMCLAHLANHILVKAIPDQAGREAGLEYWEEYWYTQLLPVPTNRDT